MSTDPENPTAAAGDGSEKGFVQYLQDQPGSVPAVLVPPVTETDVRPSVLESFTYLFRCDQWLLVLIIGGASIFLHGIIPFVPLMFFIGFALFFVEQSIRYPESDPFGFDFDHFSKYLERGLWPVLAQIALTFLLSIPYGLFMLAMFLGTTGLIGLATGPDSETAGIIAIDLHAEDELREGARLARGRVDDRQHLGHRLFLGRGLRVPVESGSFVEL